jgi:signal transduction histidine kinase
MPASPSRRRGLRLQLTLFYLALSIPALLLIEQTILSIKFQRCLSQLDDGRVDRVLAREAAELDAALARGVADTEIEQRLRRFVLELERPRESLGTQAAWVLLELAPHPFAASIIADGALQAAPTLGQGMVHRRWTAPLPRSAELLVLDLSVPSPWGHFGRSLSFEWPIAVSYLLLFLTGSAWFLRQRVLARIARIDAAAQAWARGDFAPHLADDSSDELGQLARDLNQMAANLKALFATRAQLATLEERRRLARDLHDTVKQKVFALSLQLAAAREGNDGMRRQQRLDEAAALVGEIQRELEDQLRELREDAGAAEDLIPALQRRLDDYSRRSGLALDLALPDQLNLTPARTETVLRIVDEALANSWRHSEARRVRVGVRRSDQWIELEIADDGRGGARESALGMGLANMRQRAESLPGASFSIVSPVGGGTLLRLRFALEDS